VDHAEGVRGDGRGTPRVQRRKRPHPPARPLPPELPVSTLVNRLKGVSAHYLRKEFTGHVSRHLLHGHLWSPSYFAASCAGAPLPVIKQYIEQQKRPG
jgi:REP element-mobilizing transposase RayT